MSELTYSEHRRGMPSTPTPERLDRLDKAVAILDETIDRLAGKLSPVLLPEEAQPAPGLVQGGETSVLGDRLDGLHRRLDALHNTLVHLVDRIDL